MFGVDRKPPKAQLDLVFADRSLVEPGTNFRLDPACRIGAPPAHYTVASGVRPCLDPDRKQRPSGRV